MKKSIYNIINITVLLITAIVFAFIYMRFDILFIDTSAVAILLLILTVLMVHGIKSIRLYFILYGNEIDFKNFLRIYCKVTPVSMILPFKIGEIFRMFCYGQYIKNYLKGITIVLIDRFMDTAALVTVLLFVLGYSRSASILTYVLFAFLIIVILVYCIFPRIYVFWKKYLLRVKATKNRIRMLNILEIMQVTYSEISGVINGRGVIGFFLSLVAWGIEIGSIIIISHMREAIESEVVISKYLLAAINGQQTIYSSQFIFVTVIGLTLLYIILKFCEEKTDRKGDNK